MGRMVVELKRELGLRVDFMLLIFRADFVLRALLEISKLFSADVSSHVLTQSITSISSSWYVSPSSTSR